MVFLFDSLCALALLVSTLLSWWMAAGAGAKARINLRFAAMMLAAFSAARILPSSSLAFDAALLLPSLAAAAIVLALTFPRLPPIWLSSTILVVGLADGLLASLQGAPALALSYQAGAALVLFAWGTSHFAENPRMALLSNLCAAALLSGAMAVMNVSLSAAMLFFAAFLLLAARASQAAVAEKRRQGSWLVGGEHA